MSELLIQNEKSEEKIYAEKRDGEYKIWKEYDQCWEQFSYRDGKLEGECKRYDEDRRLIAQQFFQDGKLEGKCTTFWYKNGNIRTAQFYQNGKRQGEYKLWNENGSVKICEFYRDNCLLDRKFNSAKKRTFLRIIGHLRKRTLDPIKDVVIFDLVNII